MLSIITGCSLDPCPPGRDCEIQQNTLMACIDIPTTHPVGSPLRLSPNCSINTADNDLSETGVFNQVTCPRNQSLIWVVRNQADGITYQPLLPQDEPGWATFETFFDDFRARYNFVTSNSGFQCDTTAYPEIQITRIRNYVRYNWILPANSELVNESQTNWQLPTVIFNETGNQIITLEITSEGGIKSSVEASININ